MKTILLALALLASIAGTGRAQSTSAIDSVHRPAGRTVRIPDRRIAIVDYLTPRSRVGLEKNLHRVGRHPGLDTPLTSDEKAAILTEIEARCEALGKDSLLTSDLFWVMRPWYDRLHHEDPHYRIATVATFDSTVYPRPSDRRKARKKVRMPGFSLLRINDTLVIDRSLDPSFRPGDRITAINGRPTAEYLRYVYDDRYTEPSTLLACCFYEIMAPRWRIDLCRDGAPLAVDTEGLPYRDALFRLSKAEETDANIRTYDSCGYIAIPEFFPDNSRLIRIVRRAIVGFRKRGIVDVVLDLRRNPGGSGHAFDELLSIFIDKPVVEYCTGQRVKASREAMRYYGFLTEEQLGEVVELPEDQYVRSFETDPEMYVGDMRYYVLVSRDTGSIAASFANMLQYHGGALLAGEPLRHNALKYGEVLDGWWFSPVQLAESAVSMVEIDECTRRDDGYVLPDIPIPAIAAEYLTGATGCSTVCWRRSATATADNAEGPRRRRRPGFRAEAGSMKHPLDVGGVILDGRFVLLLEEERRRDEVVGRGAVDRRGDVVERGQAQQRLDIDVVGLRRHRVAEEDQGANASVDDERPQLLVAAQRTRTQQADVQPLGRALRPAVGAQRAFDHAARRAGAHQRVERQQGAVPLDPLREILFHVVVRHERHHFPFVHRLSFFGC